MMKKGEKDDKKPEKKKIFDPKIPKKSFEFHEESLPKNITNKSQIPEEIPGKIKENNNEFEISEIKIEKNEVETNEI